MTWGPRSSSANHCLSSSLSSKLLKLWNSLPGRPTPQPYPFPLRHEIPEEIPVLRDGHFNTLIGKGSDPIVSRLSSLPPGWIHWSIWASDTKMPLVGCLTDNRNWLFTVQWGLKSKLKVPADSMSGRAFLPFDRQRLLDVPLTC